MPNDPQYLGGVEQRPDLDRHLQSNIEGIHIIGAANGSPLLKTCVNEGVQVVRSLSRLMPPARQGEGVVDLIIVGAGPAGLAAALEARKRGYRFLILEQGRPLNTILNFPAGKHIYAEPPNLPGLGDLDLEDSSKEELLRRWSERTMDLEITRGANVTDVRKKGDRFLVRSEDGRAFEGRRLILAIGRMGNPRKLGVPGEDLPCTYTALLNPGKYRDQDILVVGGGNSAVEAAVALSASNRVTLVHRGDDFQRASRVNRSLLEQAASERGLRVILSAQVTEFRLGEASVQAGGNVITLKQDAAFVLVGADPPVAFLRRLGVRFEGQWGLARLPHLAWVFALVYSIYAIKGDHWPFHGIYSSLNAAGTDPGLLYGILYSALMSFFGLKALRRYREDPYQQKRYGSLIASQWLIYFLLPWGLYYVGYQHWWRTWGVTLTYPLGYYGLFEPAHQLFSGSALPWALATLAAFLVVIPIVSAFHGKRFCAWVCPCGGIADTVGDAWRHKAPRGVRARKVENSSTLVLAVTLLASIYLISGYRNYVAPQRVAHLYRFVVDFGLASVVAITLYPFLGGRIWCRFFCPLARWMELWGRWTGGNLAVVPNNECISCGECTRYCQMGIDVRAFAQREQPLSNRTTTCIFCGICVTVCPVDVLHVERDGKR